MLLVGCLAAAPTDNEALALFRDKVLARAPGATTHMDGRHSTRIGAALSMAGQRRLDHTATLVAKVVEDGVPGHFLETGVFRGGMSFVAAKTFELLGARAEGRRVYLADSFSGLPNLQQYVPASTSSGAARGHKLDGQERQAHHIALLNRNSLQAVQASAVRLQLDTSRLRFLPGYFNETLPRLIAEEGATLQLAVLRLDGDAFASTLEAIELLYPYLSPGGFLVIDDYVDWKSCREAIDLYRQRHGIKEPLTLIPHQEGEIVRGAYWRKQPREGQELCVSSGDSRSLRISGGIFPTKLVPVAQANEPIPRKKHGVSIDYIQGLRRPGDQLLHMCIPA